MSRFNLDVVSGSGAEVAAPIFDDLVGQDHVTRTLSNAIRAGRVAHAFLFTGVRGVGKTTAARILAKALNCQQGPTAEPCNALQ